LALNLTRHGTPKALWRQGAASCLELRARIFLKNGNADAALPAAQQSIRILQNVHSGDKIKDAYLLADAWRLLGDVQRQRGNAAAAAAAWQTSAQQLPRSTAGQPHET